MGDFHLSRLASTKAYNPRSFHALLALIQRAGGSVRTPVAPARAEHLKNSGISLQTEIQRQHRQHTYPHPTENHCNRYAERCCHRKLPGLPLGCRLCRYQPNRTEETALPLNERLFLPEIVHCRFPVAALNSPHGTSGGYQSWSYRLHRLPGACRCLE